MMRPRTIEHIFRKTNDWDSFLSEVSDCDSKTKGDAFELIVKSYLLSEPIYKSKLRSVWLLSEVPLKILRDLNLPSQDQGIDLIAETYAGEYWAVQCKFYSDTSRSLTWREVSTFTGLAFGICKNISFGLICTTGQRYAKILEGQNNIGLCTSETWQALEKEFFRNITDGVVTPQLVPYRPRPHQERAISKTKEYFSHPLNSRGKLIMPCGTGKSLTSYWINERMDAKLTLIAVPSISLLRQTLHVWLRELQSSGASRDLEWLCVCSDETVSESSSDDIVTFPQDLGIPCTTSTADIQEWLSKTSGAKKRIIFTTYQSGKSLARACRVMSVHFDLGIMDEAHKTVGRHDSLFAYLLFNKNIDIKKRLFMTATERRYIGKSDQIASMENADLYGETIELLTFKEAILQKPQIVVDYKIITLFISRAEVAELVLRNKFVKPKQGSWNEEVEAEMLASLVAIKKAMQQYPIRHTVSFHSSVARAKAFKENADLYTKSFPKLGALDTYHISGKAPSSLRQRVLTEFDNSKHALVTNARCLTEGIDLPSIDCVIFADPKKSKVDIVQALGRALRPAPGKEFGYIVIPVLIDKLNDVESFVESSSFSSLLLTLRALASNDERVIDYFRDRTNGRRPQYSLINEGLVASALAEAIDIEDFTNAVNLYCWDNLVKLSYKDFNAAKRFVRNLNLHNEKEWKYYCENQLHGVDPKPPAIPESPSDVYKDVWKGWDDWLGRKPVGVRYVKFELARSFARRQMLDNQDDWKKFVERQNPSNIPANPHIIYYREWKGWDDWLYFDDEGEFPTFIVARERARSSGIKNRGEWYRYLFESKDIDLPVRPDRIYAKEWQGWKDWLRVEIQANMANAAKETVAISKRRMEFESARQFARSLGIKDRASWRKYCIGQLEGYASRPGHIPTHPESRWKGYWEGWDDWLGLKSDESPGGAANVSPIKTVEYLSFHDARNFARTLMLSGKKEWKLYCSDGLERHEPKPDEIPSNPKVWFKKEWKGWDDWLREPGSVRSSSQYYALEKDEDPYIPFNLARVYVRKQNIEGRVGWFKHFNDGKLPEYLPRRPDLIYKNEWVSWDDWLSAQDNTVNSVKGG